MHEVTVTQDILEKALDAAKVNNAKAITKIRIKVGDFTGFDPGCISFYFELMAKDTIAEGAVLEFEKIPLSLNCSACDLTFTPEDFPLSFACPACGNTRNRLVSGKELSVEDMEIDV
ncbi:MAG: hydrogenase maturation nickel metallochaperone HypA [Chloroflexi bacterium]|nr:hydrogenase maturation nickel metallochaperone HypA [Chloroflexota bacterium]